MGVWWVRAPRHNDHPTFTRTHSKKKRTLVGGPCVSTLSPTKNPFPRVENCQIKSLNFIFSLSFLISNLNLDKIIKKEPVEW